jgi:DNA-directed RNA polymerase subunit M/transcription elongation factor TFIIS
MKIDDSTTFRRNIVDKFRANLEEKQAINIEKGIYNWTIREASSRKIVKKWDNRFFVLIYIDRLRTIWLNLTEEIIVKIKNQELKAQEVAFMTHQELNANKWEDIIQRKMLRDKSKYETVVEASSDSFVCRKCRKNKTTHYQLQTRSADEPMTTFVTCLTCDARWKC